MPDPDGPPPERWGFKLSREQSDQGWLRLSQLVVSFPHWSALLVAAIVPFVRVLRLSNRRRRTGRGLCAHCGYDLIPSPKPVVAAVARG